MSDITQRQLEAFDRFVAQLPHGKDLELLLIKGHLLIEEQIRELINSRLQNAEALREPNAKFECHQAICLAQAFFPIDHYPDVWRSAKKLNKLRNDVAHNLVSNANLIAKVDGWSQIFLGTQKLGNTKQQQFEFALWRLFEAISSFVEAP